MNACHRCILFVWYFVCSVMINWLSFLNVHGTWKIIIHYRCVLYLYWLFLIFIHFVVYLMKSLQPLPKQVLHRVRSIAYSFYFQYPLIFWSAASSCLHLLPHLPIFFPTFPSIMCCVRQFLCKMWPIQLAFLLFVVCRIFLSSLTQCNISFLTRSVQVIFSIFAQHHISELFRCFQSTFWSVQRHTELCSKGSILVVSSLNLSPIWWWKEPSVASNTVASFSCTLNRC